MVCVAHWTQTQSLAGFGKHKYDYSILSINDVFMRALNIRLVLIIVALFIGLNSCTAQGPAFKPAPQPSSDRSLVYIYRQTSFCGGLVNFDLSIDGKYLANIPNGAYTNFYIPLGSYSLTAYDTLNQRSHRSGLNMNLQETKYLELDPCPSGFPALSGSILFERSRSTALSEISKTKHQYSSNPFRFNRTITKQNSTTTSKTAKVVASKTREAKGKAVVIPTGAIGEISSSQKMIITNKFIDDLSNDYDLVSQEKYDKAEEQAFQELNYEECTEEQCIRLIQEMLQVENMYKLELIREGKDTQINLTLIDLDKKLLKSHYCESCKTPDLIKSVSKLYKDLEAKR